MDEGKASFSLPSAFPVSVSVYHAGVGKTLLRNSIAPPLLLIVPSPFPAYLHHVNVLESSQSCLLPPARPVQLTVLFQEQKGELYDKEQDFSIPKALHTYDQKI